MTWHGVPGVLTGVGLIAGLLVPPPVAAVLAGLALVFALGAVLIAGRKQTRGRTPLLLVAPVLVAMGAGMVRRPEPPVIASRLEGVIAAGRIQTWSPRANGIVIEFLVHAVDGERLHRPWRVFLFGDASWGLSPRSAWMRVSGRIEPERGRTRPGSGFPRRRSGRLVVERGTHPDWGPGPAPRGPRIRSWIAERVGERLPGFAGRFAEAVLLGRSAALLPEERALFRRAGVSHLVAVSGLHVGLVAGLGILILAGAPGPTRAIGAAGAAWLYAALAGAPASAVRAAAMLSAALLAGRGRRSRSAFGWLVLAVPWMIWFDPSRLLDPGFQLSVTAVGGLLFAAELGGSGRRVLTGLAASLGAQWGTLPVAVAQFGALAPLATLPNLVAIPAAGLFLPAVLLTLALPGGAIAGDAAQFLGAALKELLLALDEHLPYLAHLPEPPACLRPLGLVVVVFWFGLAPRVRRRLRARAIALGGAGILVGLWCFPFPPPAGPWIAFLDVGQGDSAVARLSDGTVWVIDVGDDRGPGDAASGVILPVLRHLRIRAVDGLVVSHRHRDHVGALEPFLDAVPVRAVYDAGYGSRTGTSGWMDGVLGDRGLWPCLVARGDTLHQGPEVRLVVLHPERGDPERRRPGNLNDRSLVLRLEDRGRSVLFAGDLERPGETLCLRSGTFAPAEGLKVGHHGSRTSTHLPFLAGVAPDWAIISCGAENRFGHPAPVTVNRLAEEGVRTWRTDRDGTILVTPMASGVDVRSWPPVGAGTCPGARPSGRVQRFLEGRIHR